MKSAVGKLAAAVLALVLLCADVCAFAKPLATIELPDALKLIGEEAFYGDTSIEKVVVPDGTTAIRSKAFAGSTLKEINLPESITSIASDSFDGCGEISVTARQGSYAYQWAVRKGYIIPPSSKYSLESAHPYAADMDKTWEYTHPTDAAALKVRFSTETKFEQGYDFLIVTGSTGIAVQYTGEELSGKELILPGNSFSLTLKSDEAEQHYGFSVASIEAASWEEVAAAVLTTRTLDDGTLEISGHNGCFAELVIPTSINGKQVTSIGNSAFEEYDLLRKLTIPEGVTSIGRDAFYGCDSLTEVSLPSTLVHIGVNAFSFCISLVEVTLPGSLTEMEGYAFNGCDKLEKVTVSEGIKYIGNNAFEGCDKLVYVSLPSTLTSIMDLAFAYCHNLQSITIPEGVTSIGELAFYECTSLGSINLPDSVTSIGKEAFAYCTVLTQINIPAGVSEIGSKAFNKCKKLTATVVHGSSAHKWCKSNSVKCVTLLAAPKNVSATANGNSIRVKWGEVSGAKGYIIYYSFSAEGVYKKAGTYSSKVKSINYINLDTDRTYYFKVSAYDDTQEGPMSSVVFDKTATMEEVFAPTLTTKTLADGTLEITGYDGSYTKLSIPAKINGKQVTSIGSEAFQNFNDLERVAIPEGVTSIGTDAFRSCDKLAEVNLPSTLTDIGKNAFAFCYALVEITIPEGVSAIPERAFYGCSSLKKVDLPASVQTIGQSAFYECSGMESVNLPSALTAIGEHAFRGCSSLKKVDIPAGVKTIGRSAFYECSGMESVNLPSTLINIGEYAFYGCSSLKKVDIPSGVSAIPERAFYGCSSLKKVDLPASVQTIGQSAFYECSGMESVNLPSALTAIGQHAFYGCSSLKKVDIPAGVQTIDYAAFAYCSALTEVSISEGTTTLGDFVFYDCTGLERITLPASLNSIGVKAFYNCSELTAWVDYGSTAYYWCISEHISYRIDLPAPELLIAYGLSDSSIEISWNYVNGADGYRIYRSTSPISGYSLITNITGGYTWDWTDTGLAANTTYYYKVTATDRFGNESPLMLSEYAFARTYNTLPGKQ